MRVFVEGYGCSMNLAEAEQIRGFVQSQKAELVDAPESADVLIVHSCAVKDITENRMKNRIGKLDAIAEATGARVLVSGCLPGANASALSGLGSRVEIAGVGLDALARSLGLESENFSPAIPSVRSKGPVSILPVSRGCLSACSFCATRLARGKLYSHPVDALVARFRADVQALSGQRAEPVFGSAKGLDRVARSLSGESVLIDQADSAAGARVPEVWITSQDLGCYGMDRGQNVCDLVEALLAVQGEYRIRLGMMSPQYVSRFFDRFVRLFEDPRLYRFVHLPVQSGSDRVLRDMKRAYSRAYFLDLVDRLRDRLGDFSLATDVIVGFPGESNEDFEQSWSLIEKTRPVVVNLARFGARPGTAAAAMENQWHGREKKARSRAFVSRLRKLGQSLNDPFVGTEHLVLVSEKNPHGDFVGRTSAYRPVILEGFSGSLGDLARVRITEARSFYFKGAVVVQKDLSDIARYAVAH